MRFSLKFLGSPDKKLCNLLAERDLDLAPEHPKTLFILKKAPLTRKPPSQPQFGWGKHQPGEECKRVQIFAVVRYKAKAGGDLFWRYAYVVGGGCL